MQQRGFYVQQVSIKYLACLKAVKYKYKSNTQALSDYKVWAQCNRLSLRTQKCNFVECKVEELGQVELLRDSASWANKLTLRRGTNSIKVCTFVRWSFTRELTFMKTLSHLNIKCSIYVCFLSLLINMQWNKASNFIWFCWYFVDVYHLISFDWLKFWSNISFFYSTSIKIKISHLKQVNFFWFC